MSYQINGYTVIDDTRKVITTTKISSSKCDIPSGTTAERPSSPATGSIRYNTTISSIEYYDGVQWVQFQQSIPLSFSGRGIFGGGSTPAVTSNISYITIPTLSNTTPFGSLTEARHSLGSCSSSTRGLFGCGRLTTPGAASSTVDYVTISTTSNALSWGTLSPARFKLGACSNATEGLFIGGDRVTPLTATSTVDKVTIATTGSVSSFNNIYTPAIVSVSDYDLAAISTPTTAYVSGGVLRSPNIYYTAYASAGSWTSFGNLGTPGKSSHIGANNSVRGLFAGGFSNAAPGGTTVSTIQYITFSTLGISASSFGNLTAARSKLAAVCTPTRAVFAGGTSSPVAVSNTMDYIDDFSNRSSAVSFGTLSTATTDLAGCSNSHAGLGY